MRSDNSTTRRRGRILAACGLTFSLAIPSLARAEDWPMWGRTPDRNMVSLEKGPPTEWE